MIHLASDSYEDGRKVSLYRLHPKIRHGRTVPVPQRAIERLSALDIAIGPRAALELSQEADLRPEA